MIKLIHTIKGYNVWKDANGLFAISKVEDKKPTWCGYKYLHVVLSQKGITI